MGTEPGSAYVDSRRVGDATVTIVNDGSFFWAPEIQVAEAAWRQAMPDANAAGEIAIDLNLAHIRLRDASILIDLGFSDPASGESRNPRLVRTLGVVAGLATIGVHPDDITHVVITHAHGDHFEGATVERNGERRATFPRARYFMNRADWDTYLANASPNSAHAVQLGTLDRLGQLDLVNGDRELVPGVTMIHAPGESKGHSIVRVTSNGESFFYLGDLFHHPCEVANLDWVSPGRDRAAARASRERLIAEAVPNRSLLVYTHRAFPGWGRISAANGGYRFSDA